MPKTTRNKVLLNSQGNQIARWAMKVLLDLRGWKRLQKNHARFTSDFEILASVGLGHLEDTELTEKEFVEILKTQRGNIENKPASINSSLACNINFFAKYIGLSSTEKQILIFAVILQGDKGLVAVTDSIGELNAEEVVDALSNILELDLPKVREALSRNGLLARSGLLTLTRESKNEINYKFDLLEGLAEALHEPGAKIETMLGDYFTLATQPELAEVNFRHVIDHFTMIREHLKHACTHRGRGVNILVYGPPGTGKTEFAKAVTMSLGYKLYEVNISAEDRPFNKQKRLRAFQLAQQVLGRQQNAILLFDEIDSLLTENFSFFQRDNDSLNLKSCINKNLENSKVPAIWIANDLRFADSAFIRRFDIVFNLSYPPRSTRLEILGNSLEGLPIRRQWLERLADNKFIAPGVIAKASHVLRCQKLQDPTEVEKKLEKLLESTLTAMGYPRKPVIETRSLVKYRLDAVNSDHDLAGIIQGLQSRDEGRLCLYGPPGTGKTEFGYYLARQLDRPLLVKRSSDLLGPYVGETEANIAAMFQEAAYEKAVLLLDEADSFLRDRSGAHRSWEVTQVNELLTQMESYKGVFVCSTNLMDSLDAASLRRFDLKIKFDFLKPKQAWELFQAILTANDTKLSRKKYWQGELRQYDLLTPGDFATVVRKNRISGSDMSAKLMINGLAAEMNFKDTATSRRIGF